MTGIDIAAELSRLGLPGLPESLPVATIDSHTHLDATADYSGLPVELSLAAAAQVGIDKVVQVGCDLPSSQWAADAASTYPQVIATVAIHPNDAARMSCTELDAALEQIGELAGQAGVRAVGETGLDYYRTREPAAQAQQRRSFASHIAIAHQHDLALAIHDREAHDDVLEILDAQGWPERVVMHCFSGGAEHARACLSRHSEVFLSFSGTVTFKAKQHLREALALTPVDRLLVETDAPYLTPVPARGKPNAPYLVPHTVRFMAAELGSDIATLCQQLRVNAEAAFGGPWGQCDG